MKIVSAVFAVLGLTAVIPHSIANEYYNATFLDSQQQQHSRHGNRSHRKRAQYEECCPTVLEMVEPIGGKNQEGLYVELYRDNNYRQRFYELSCTKEVLNKSCNLINKKKSKCVQRTSFTYALVKNTKDHRDKNLPMFPTRTGGEVAYTLDYIQVRSGCSCVVQSSKKKRSNSSASAADRHAAAAARNNHGT